MLALNFVYMKLEELFCRGPFFSFTNVNLMFSDISKQHFCLDCAQVCLQHECCAVMVMPEDYLFVNNAEIFLSFFPSLHFHVLCCLNIIYLISVSQDNYNLP